MDSPVIVQSNPTFAVATSHSAAYPSNTVADNDLLALIFTTTNTPAQVTVPAAPWVKLAQVGGSAGNPLLTILHRKSPGGAVSLPITTVVSAPIRSHLYEIAGAAATSPYDGPTSDAAGSAGLTTRSTGTIPSPRARPGLLIAAAAFSPAPATAPAWSNGFTPRHYAGALASAVLTHAGSGPFNSTATWTGGATPRTAIINFVPDLDPPVATGGWSWGWGPVVA